MEGMTGVVFALTTAAVTNPAVVEIDAVQALVSNPANGPVAAVTDGFVSIAGVV